MSYLLKGLLIGLLLGLPVGAVGTMTVQRTWNYGFKAGMLTGLGSSVADCLYAIVGAFGLTLISEFLLQHQMIISVFGGGLILFMGICMIQKKGGTVAAEMKAAGGAKLFLSSFTVAITNPVAILTFLFAFSYFGIPGTAGVLDGALLVCGVFLGTYIWWGTLSVMTCAVKKKTRGHHIPYMNQIFGTILSVFGAVVFLRLFL